MMTLAHNTLPDEVYVCDPHLCVKSFQKNKRNREKEDSCFRSQDPIPLPPPTARSAPPQNGQNFPFRSVRCSDSS